MVGNIEKVLYKATDNDTHKEAETALPLYVYLAPVGGSVILLILTLSAYCMAKKLCYKNSE